MSRIQGNPKKSNKIANNSFYYLKLIYFIIKIRRTVYFIWMQLIKQLSKIFGTSVLDPPRFPLIVFGFSDLTLKFHPLFFMFTSNETEADYDHFFHSMKELLKSSNIDFDNLYKNIRSRKSSIPKSEYLT